MTGTVRAVVLVLISAAAVLAATIPAPGEEASPERRVEGQVLVSDDLPAIRIRVHDAFAFIGRVPFRIADRAAGERLLFAEIEGRTIRRLLMAQFEGFLPGAEGRFNYDFSHAETFAGHRFRHNNFAFSNRAAAAENPTFEAAKTAAFLREAGYGFADEWLMARFLTVPDEARRHELILFYIEMGPDAGLGLDEIYTPEGADTPAWTAFGKDLRERALSAFEVLE